jgi:hypothetical protein
MCDWNLYRLFFLPAAGRDALWGKIFKHSWATFQNFNEIGREKKHKKTIDIF